MTLAKSRLLFVSCLIISGLASYYLASWAGQLAFMCLLSFPLACRLFGLARCECLMAALLLSFIVGCQHKDSVSLGQIDSPVSSTDPDDLIEDVGRVIAGNAVQHEFSINNPSEEPISIQSDADIQRNCGCSSLEPAARLIEPGSQTHVKATILTSGRNGPFAYGGTIIWTAASGTKREVKLTIKGVVESPFRCKPEVVNFLADEIRNGIVKEVLLTENVPVDWTSLSIATSCPQVAIVGLRTEQHSARFGIRCSIPEGLESFQCTFSAQARVADDSPLLPGSQVSLTVPILARQNLDLVITPKMLPITFRKNKATGNARLLLRGELIAKNKPVIKRMECRGYKVAWDVTDPVDNTAIVKLVFTPTAGVSFPAELLIELEGKGLLRVPLIQVRLQ